MSFSGAVEDALYERSAGVITEVDFHRLTQTLFANGRWRGEPISRLPKAWDSSRVSALLSRFIREGILTRDRDFGRGVYRILDKEGGETAEQVATLVDPFCYVSHESAMRLHGLRKGPDAPLHLSTLTRKAWSERHAANVGSDATPSYPRIVLGGRLRRRTVAVHEISRPSPVVEIDQVRVSTIGATFATMLAEPSFCGGVATVLAIWRRHAKEHLDDIVEAVDAIESKIVKVRAGYILTEVIGIETPRISAWSAFAQRGGSRKLDPDGPYAPVFSERWMISLNQPTAGPT